MMHEQQQPQSRERRQLRTTLHSAGCLPALGAAVQTNRLPRRNSSSTLASSQLDMRLGAPHTGGDQTQQRSTCTSTSTSGSGGSRSRSGSCGTCATRDASNSSNNCISCNNSSSSSSPLLEQQAVIRSSCEWPVRQGGTGSASPTGSTQRHLPFAEQLLAWAWRQLSGVQQGRVGHLQELVGFAVWHLVGIPSAIQAPFLWYTFWQYVCSAGSASMAGPNPLAGAIGIEDTSPVFARLALALWLLWVAAAAFYRHTVHRAVPPGVRSVLRNLELFTAAGLLVTVAANTCTMLHTPGAPLFDVGFWVIPPLGEGSWWVGVSDALTHAVPVFLVGRSLFMQRSDRCLALVSWLRCVSVAYFFRALTITLTSLPGPAAHCMGEEGYSPPRGWHDVATRLGPMVGDYSTCGDLIFSGHAAFTTTTMLCLVKTFEGRRMHGLMQLLAVAYIGAVGVLALAGRKHYTVDIAVAVLVASLTVHRFSAGWTLPGPQETKFPVRKDTLELVDWDCLGASHTAAPLPHKQTPWLLPV